MNNFLNWAIEKAQTVQVNEPFKSDEDGKMYFSTIRMFEGNLNPGKVKSLRKEYGTLPVNEKYRTVTCQWGGTYKSQAGFVRVCETIFQEVK